MDISGWHVSSTAGKTSTITIQNHTIISAKGFLIIGRESQQQQWLDNSGEGIILTTANGIQVDKVGPFTDNGNDDRTWQRSPDGSNNWIFTFNTLGASNGAPAITHKHGKNYAY